MAALTADVNASAVGDVTTIPLSANATDIYYRGSVVFIDTAGGCQVTCADGDRVAGVSPKYQSVTSGDDVEVITEGQVWLPVGTNIAAADEGEIVCVDASAAQTDNPADLYSAGDLTLETLKDTALGRIKRVTATQMLVQLGDITGSIYVTSSGWGS